MLKLNKKDKLENGFSNNFIKKTMELKEIKNLNQRIYELDTDINRSCKMIFISTLIICLVCNSDFQDSSKLSTLIKFNDEEERPIDQIIDIAKKCIEDLKLSENTKNAVFNSFKIIAGVNTSLDSDRQEFKKFVSDFITEYFVSIKTNDLFLETLYMEIDKKAQSNNEGVVLTPTFAAELMIELAELDYKKDIVADLCSGTGLFSLLSNSRMLTNLETDYKNNIINGDDYRKYKKRLFNSIIANDSEPKMVTISLANMLLKKLNPNLLYYGDVLDLQKSSFKLLNENGETKIQPTKAILNPPFEDKYKPLEILEKNVQLVKDDDNSNNKVIVIIPPQKFVKKKEVLSRILNLSTLEKVIKMQDNLFSDNGKSQSASIYVFNTAKPHSKNDVVKFYNFTDTGYVYLKDSGLVDKNNEYEEKKKMLLNRMKSNKKIQGNFKREWTNFYDIILEPVYETKIDVNRVKTSKEEADISLENVVIRKALKEKENLIQSTNNNYIDEDGKFEEYIINILSED